MSETIQGEVLLSISPEELGEYDLEPGLHERAMTESRHVLVCRKGGHPSIPQLIWAFVRRDPIEPITILADAGADEGAEVRATVEETKLAGVYAAAEFEAT